MTSPKCSICVWIHKLNVSIKYFNVVYFKKKRARKEGGFCVENIYGEKREGELSEHTCENRRYSWKGKKIETAPAERQVRHLPTPPC